MSFYKKKQIRFDGTKEFNSKIKNQTDNVISRRFKITIACIVFIAICLLARLFYLQIERQDYYTGKLAQYNSSTFTTDTFRGDIYDRDYKRLVYNKNINTVTYYAVKGIQQEDIDIIINFLIKNVDIDTKSVTLREKKDFLIKKDPEFAKSLIKPSELKNEDQVIYRLQLDRISKDIVDEKLTKYDLKYYMLYFKIMNCQSGSVVLLDDLSIKEASVIAEHSDILKGIKITNNWSREYTYKNTFSSVLGKVTTKKQGLPLSSRDILLAQDYNNDSRVGISGLEAQYESLLSGTSAKYSISYDQEGLPIIQPISSGTKGSNLRLTIDWEIQEVLSKAVEKELKAHTGYAERHNNNIFVVMMDPNNGEVIAMVGKQRLESGEIIDFSAGAYLSAYEIGSTFKGATVYTAFKRDLIQPNTYFIDEPWKIAGTNLKKSYKNMGRINEIDALAQSSNVYMFEIMTRLGEAKYVYNQPLKINEQAFDLLRLDAGELGLGVKTGLDVPYESLGYRGPVTSRLGGNLLDAGIGQYDTYTTVQMAQYISTLANGGKRIQPHFFMEAFQENEYNEKITQLQYKIQVLDDVSQYNIAFERVQKGFREGCVRGLAKPTDGHYKAAGKTGTAEVYDKSVSNRSYIGYAPFDNPQIAVAVMCEAQNKNGSNQRLAKLAFDTYFEKYDVKSK